MVYHTHVAHINPLFIMYFSHFGHETLEVILLMLIYFHASHGSLIIFKAYLIFQGVGHTL